MPTPRKSLAQLAASGTLGKNLGRYKSRLAAVPTIIHPPGRAPAHFNVKQKAVWAEILRTAPQGVLTKSDRLAIEILVNMLLKIRSIDAPSTSDYNAIVNMFGKMALTPASRHSMNVERTPGPHELSAEERAFAALDELD